MREEERVSDHVEGAGSLKSLSDFEVAKLTALSSVSKALNTSYDLDIVLWSVLEQVMTVMGAERGFIQLTARAGRERVALDRTTEPWRREFLYSQSLVDQCIDGPSPVLMLDACDEAVGSESVKISGIRSVIIQPLLSEEHLLGIIYLDTLMEAGRFQENDLVMLGVIGEMVALAIQRARDSSRLTLKTERVRELQQELASANAGLGDASRETITRLALVCEYRDDYGGNHICRIREYCRLLADELGLPPDAAEELGFASQLHDVGMVAVPDSVLRKEGRLTPGERQVMENHTVIGHGLLADSQSVLIQLGQQIARSHHERWDGNGYPDGRKGDEIPISARIVAVADTFDAIVRRRAYRKTGTLKQAFEAIEEGAGSQFDPRVSEAFLAVRNKIVGLWGKYPDV